VYGFGKNRIYSRQERLDPEIYEIFSKKIKKYDYGLDKKTVSVKKVIHRFKKNANYRKTK
jgi:hypothetical protein